MTGNATVIRERGVTLDGEHHAKGAVLRLPRNQFDDLAAVGIVREATDAEVNRDRARHVAEKPACRSSAVNAAPTGADQPASPAAD